MYAIKTILLKVNHQTICKNAKPTTGCVCGCFLDKVWQKCKVKHVLVICVLFAFSTSNILSGGKNSRRKIDRGSGR